MSRDRIDGRCQKNTKPAARPAVWNRSGPFRLVDFPQSLPVARAALRVGVVCVFSRDPGFSVLTVATIARFALIHSDLPDERQVTDYYK